MKALTDLITTDYGLMSAAGIIAGHAVARYFAHIKRRARRAPDHRCVGASTALALKSRLRCLFQRHAVAEGQRVAVADDGLVAQQHVGHRAQHVGGQLARRGQQFVGRHHAVDEAPGRRLLGATQLPVNDTSRAR
jgi:hypothetical protein